MTSEPKKQSGSSPEEKGEKKKPPSKASSDSVGFVFPRDIDPDEAAEAIKALAKRHQKPKDE